MYVPWHTFVKLSVTEFLARVFLPEIGIAGSGAGALSFYWSDAKIFFRN